MWHQWSNCNVTKLRELLFCTLLKFFSSTSPSSAIIKSIPKHWQMVNKVFFAHKKLSHSLIKLRLNHWCHMDYFNDDLTTFLCSMNISVTLLSMQGQKALGFNKKKILIRVLKMNVCLTVWNDMGWVTNDGIFIFGWPIPLKYFFQ